MVRTKLMEQSLRTDINLLRPFIEGHPLLAELAGREGPCIYLAGGAVRDLLAGFEPVDLDLVVEEGARDLALELSADALVHDRFETAELVVKGDRLDIATARRETYAYPGALPEVQPATISEDLVRRDFTINAMAVSLSEPETLIDPHGGEQDLRRGVIRVLHARSFVDDPTRALRAARYAARFGFDLDPATTDLLLGVDLKTVSQERATRELELMVNEPTGIEALRLASAWSLIKVEPDRLDLARAAVTLLDTDTWRGRTTRGELVWQAVFDEVPELPEEPPATPYDGVLLARGLSPADLLVNRARGAGWLDIYEDEWSAVRPTITGDDLVAAGIPQGPAVGAGLAAALQAKLNDGVSGMEPELELAVRAAESVTDGER